MVLSKILFIVINVGGGCYMTVLISSCAITVKYPGLKEWVAVSFKSNFDNSVYS